jgi:hypothetical protein
MHTVTRSSTRIGVVAAAAIALTVGALLALGMAGGSQSASAAGAPLAVNECNAVFNVGGQGMNCDVSVVNYLNLGTSAQYSVTTVTDCDGAANTVPLPHCVVTIIPSTELVTSVTQCNGSANGGGASLICSVTVHNQLYDPLGTSTTTAATVNQCDATSGTTGTLANRVTCNPAGQTTTDATVTQCNGSGNGGGSGIIVNCTVDPSSMVTSALPVTVNQCVGSSNGGGATVTCSAFIDNRVLTLAEVNDTPVLPTAGSTTTGTSNFVAPSVGGTVSNLQGSGGTGTPTAAATLAFTGGGFGPYGLLAMIALFAGGTVCVLVVRRKLIDRARRH